MDLMLDPACEYTTFGEAVKVGWACDEERFFWYEDPYRDGGISQFAHRKLRQLIKTPLLQTEHVRSLEPHIDFALADATDYIRGLMIIECGHEIAAVDCPILGMVVMSTDQLVLGSVRFFRKAVIDNQLVGPNM